MNFFTSKLLNKQFDVHLSADKQHIELYTNGHFSLTIEIRDVLNLNYFKPKQFVSNEKYWLSLETRKSGKIFFITQFLDESFRDDLLRLFSSGQLKEMEKRSLKKYLYYYLLPSILLGAYFANSDKSNFNGLLVLAIFFFFFNSIAIYNELSKFNKCKKIRNQ
jgi:hypothetical protein